MGVAGVLSHCERFSLATKEWKEIASLNMKSCTAVATIYLSKVYIFGGYRGDGRNKHIERYNELTNLWENVPFLLNNPIEAESLIPLSGHEFVMFGGKDDFMEQNYVIVYDLERGSMKQEKEMIYKRILCKVAKFNEIIYVVGGHADKTCEMAKIGEWQWKEFEGYEKYIDAGLDKPSLVKNAFAQSY
jgi:N-acetylneuraminic acid mutarotase